MDQLKLYQIDMKYVRDLHNADSRVESVSPQIGKANRVFVGIDAETDKKTAKVFKGKKRCLDFKKLERICDKYNGIAQSENKKTVHSQT